MSADIRVEHHCSIVLLCAQNDDAQRWLRDKLDPNAMWWTNEKVACEPRYCPRWWNKVRFEDAAEDLKAHYRTTGSRNLKEAEVRFVPLRAFFTGTRLAGIGPAEITRYVASRQGQGFPTRRSIASWRCWGSCAGLPTRTTSSCGSRSSISSRRPATVGVLRVRRLRAGPAAASPGPAVRGRDRVRAWVARPERGADPGAPAGGPRGRTIRLDVGSTKNDDGRAVSLSPDLQAEITAQIERVRALELKTGRVIPYLFPHFQNSNRVVAGDRLRDFNLAWRNSCDRAGYPGTLRHDLRWTAVRNLVNAGLSERVAMTVTGHKTRSVFDRYHIVSPADLQDAARKLAAHRPTIARNTVIRLASTGSGSR